MPRKKLPDRQTIEDQMDEHFNNILLSKTNYSSNDLYERFPQQMRDGLANAKQCYFKMFDDFKQALDEIPYFNDVFSHNTGKGFLGGMDREHVEKLHLMDLKKQIMIGEVVSALLSGSFEQYERTNAPKSWKRDVLEMEVSSDDENEDGEESDEEGNTQQKTRKAKKKAKKSKKRRGGGAKKKTKQKQQDEPKSKAEEEEEEEEGSSSVKMNPTEQTELKLTLSKGLNPLGSDQSARPIRNRADRKVQVVKETDEGTLIKFRGKYITLAREYEFEEQLDYDYGRNKFHLDRLNKDMIKVCESVVDFLDVDMEAQRQGLFDNLTNMWNECQTSLVPSDEQTQKMETIAELVRNLGMAKEDHSSFRRGNKDCLELQRVRDERNRICMDHFLKSIWRLFVEDDADTDDGDRFSEEDVESAFLVNERDRVMLIPTCDCHGPCPCCCSGCYDYRHLNITHNAEESKRGFYEKPRHPNDNRSRLKHVLKKDKSATSTDEQGRPKIEELSDSEEEVEEDLKLAAKKRRVFYRFEDVDQEWFDECSHCCCQCDLQKIEMLQNKIKPEQPTPETFESFAIGFCEKLTSCDNLKYHKSIFKEAAFISSAGSDHMLRQKVLEICLPIFMEAIKKREMGTRMYLVHLVLKITMSMVVARKYCFRDPNFFQYLANMLTLVDPCKNRDPNQLRADTCHLLYVSLMGCGREYFIKVSRTKAFEHLIDILQLVPDNHSDAQSAEDAFGCLTLFTDEWDLFIHKFSKAPINKLIEEWRRYGLEYAGGLPNFIYTLENLKKRLYCIIHAYRMNKMTFRLDKTFNAEALQEHSLVGCSNPKCYKLNYTTLGEYKYKKCSKCHLAYYCTKACQLTHWKTHKKYCVKPIWETEKEKQCDVNSNDIPSIVQPPKPPKTTRNFNPSNESKLKCGITADMVSKLASSQGRMTQRL
eukprot:TCONS_00071323-protein